MTTSSPPQWTSVLPTPLASAARAAALDVADRLRDPAQVARAARLAPTQTAFASSAHWQPLSLAQGDAGLALVCGHLDALDPGDGWDEVGHDYLAAAAQDAERRTQLPIGMFAGLAGLGCAASSLARGEQRYGRLRLEIDSTLVPLATATAQRMARADPAAGLSVGEFDVISGLAGVVAYLLDRPASGAALRGVLAALADLAGSTATPPCWWTPPSLMGNPEMVAAYPDGNLNCGLAHGLPGPLAAMALALEAGHDVDGVATAVDTGASWLAEHRADDAWGVNWPLAVSVAGRPSPPTRSAWCYGAPGVARALWLAGRARGVSAWQDLAVAAMEAVLRRPLASRAIDSPTICHGVAGLLQVTLRFAHETGNPVFLEGATTLVEQVLGVYEPASLLGFRNLEPGGGRVDQAGLLEGAPGVALVLLAAATDVEPTWDRAFVLS